MKDPTSAPPTPAVRRTRRGRGFVALADEAEFDRVFKQGQRHRLGSLQVLSLRRPEGFRVGFKIGRKVGKAVVRNLLRRRIKGLLDARRPAPGRGVDLVVVVNPGTDRLSFAELAAKLEPVFEAVGLVVREREP